MIATLANTAWLASALPAARRLRLALTEPATAQRRWLRDHLRRNAGSAFAREHDLSADTELEVFRQKVPIRDYDELRPWLDRVRRGERGVLTAEPVERLMPSSGSTAAAKLLPQTRRLRREFDAAIGPWVIDLFRRHPRAMRGRAYWSVTPSMPLPAVESAVPIGFDDDADYLGGVRAALVRRVMAVPGDVAAAGDFIDATVRHLLDAGDLSLISVWHPSFLALLLDHGERQHGVRDWQAVWPRLAVVSAWGDAQAVGPLAALRRRLPWANVEAKGLLATEGVVTVPLGGRFVPAVTSHLLEFLDETGRPHLAGQLRTGGRYEVALTTGGGLWRYRLGDLVRVEDDGSIRLIGRADAVVDLAGEKLSDGFVGDVLRRLLPGAAFAMLAPEGVGYTLFASRAVDAAVLDRALCDNPHYVHCRRLGQLRVVRVAVVGDDAYRQYVDRLNAGGRRLGEIKPAALSPLNGWRAWLR
jgi:hypothetical protein